MWLAVLFNDDRAGSVILGMYSARDAAVAKLMERFGVCDPYDPIGAVDNADGTVVDIGYVNDRNEILEELGQAVHFVPDQSTYIEV